MGWETCTEHWSSWDGSFPPVKTVGCGLMFREPIVDVRDAAEVGCKSSVRMGIERGNGTVVVAGKSGGEKVVEERACLVTGTLHRLLGRNLQG